MTTLMPKCTRCRKNCAERVHLSCGQKLCLDCSVLVADTREPCGLSCCSHCLKLYQEQKIHPELLVVKQDAMKEITCTYCDVPADKTCLKCESSFCATHLKKHPESLEHTLIEPTASLEDRKCSKHGEILTHYCTEDGSYVCMSCCMAGDHQGHSVTSLNDYAEMKKNNLRCVIEKLKEQKQEIVKQKCKERADTIGAMVSTRIGGVRNNLDGLEEEALKEAVPSFSDWASWLEKQMEEISKKIDDVTELCANTDPLTFLKKEKNVDLTDKSHPKRCNETQISQMLRRKLLKFADDLTKQVLQDLPKMRKSRIQLDMSTAHNKIVITNQGRTASWSRRRQARKCGPLRFRSRHVLSKHPFSKNHYWEVIVVGKQCSIGVAYSTIKRKITRFDSRIGYNKRSWALHIDDHLSVSHDNIKTRIPMDSPVQSFGIFLEYNDGRLSFYQLCNPIRHLHTFTTTFTKHLHAAFFLSEFSSVTIKN